MLSKRFANVVRLWKCRSKIANFILQVLPGNVSLDDLKNSTDDVEKLIGSGDIQAANRLAIALIQGLRSQGNATKESEEEKEEKTEVKFKNAFKEGAYLSQAGLRRVVIWGRGEGLIECFM